MNPYFNHLSIDLSLTSVFNPIKIFPPSWHYQPVPYYTWGDRGTLSGYSGEYEINLGRHPWDQYSIPGVGFGLHVSYGMEIVSFPFTPDCAFSSPLGCSGLAGTTDRNLYMPTDLYNQSDNA